MSAAGLAVALAVALVGLGMVLNHVQARLGLLEVTLNEGLPPGHEILPETAMTRTGFDALRARDLLDDGVHIFLSRGCFACQRLLDELDLRGLGVAADVHLRYVDRPRPITATVAAQIGAELHLQQLTLSESVGADPLPHTVALGPDGLVTHGATPTAALIADIARSAGIPASIKEGNLT